MKQEEMLEEIQPDEPLFIVNTTIDAAAQAEASEVAGGKKSKILGWGMIGLCAAALIYILTICIVYQAWKQNIFGLVALSLMFVYAIYSQKALPKKVVKRWEENLIRRYGTNALHLTTEFYPLSLAQTMLEGDAYLDEGYSSVTNMLESEHLFLLRYNKHQYFFVSKNGFTKGTADEFRSFIEARIGGK